MISLFTQINATIIGHIMTLIALYLNFITGNPTGMLFAIIAYGLAYFVEVFSLSEIDDKFILAAQLSSIVSLIVSYSVYFAGAYNVFL